MLQLFTAISVGFFLISPNGTADSYEREAQSTTLVPIPVCSDVCAGQLGLTEEDVNRTAAMIDSDKDGFSNLEDVCPAVADPDQSDIDGDGVGDKCDDCPNISAPGFMNGCLE